MNLTELDKYIVRYDVVEGYHLAFQVSVGDKIRTKQRLYMHNGGPFPTEIIIDLKQPQDALPVGSYFMKPSGIRANKYQSPEINGWEFRNSLVPWPIVK